MFQGTEVLTDNGWRGFSELEVSDRVASLVDGEELKFVQPTAYFEREWRGRLIHFYSRNLDFCVTPDHKVFIKKRDRKYKGQWHKKNWEFIEASEVKKGYKVKRNTRWRGRDVKFFRVPVVKAKNNIKAYNKEVVINMGVWLRFLGLWLAEGWVRGKEKCASYRVIITQSKKTREVEAILDQLPYHYTPYRGDYIIFNKSLYYFLRDLSGCENKKIPREFKDLSVRHLKVLLEGYLLGDGWKGKNGTWRAATVSEQLADDLQEIGFKLGYAVTVRKHEYSNPNWNDSYWVSFLEQTPIVGIWHKEALNYEGKVYCVEVPSHIIFIRRNGKPIWCGSSGLYNKVEPHYRSVIQEQSRLVQLPLFRL